MVRYTIQYSASPPSFFDLSDKHLTNACQEVFDLVYYGRFDSLHVAKHMTTVERRYMHNLLVDTKEKEAEAYEKASKGR